jgi:hypothetical protein
MWANPFSTNPFSTNPFSTNPFSTNPFSTNPFSTNPFDSARNYQPNPVALQTVARSSRAAAVFRATGRRSHSARRATGPQLPAAAALQGQRGPVVVVVDTGIAEHDLRPAMLADGVTPRNAPTGVRRTNPEETPDQDANDRIDPVAGHGTFIAGIIMMIAPYCDLRVLGPVPGDGDVCEHDIGLILESLASDPPDLVNLSLGGYAASDMARLARAVRTLQAAGTIIVASAGNDATCRPYFPASFDGVVSVGALGPSGPAPFTNYGTWVRACAPGVDVISTFFTEWQSQDDPDEHYAEWVEWSGTSFAAPAVVGALAAAIRGGLSKVEAVERLIDDPGLFRIPGLGAVVNQTPWWLHA